MKPTIIPCGLEDIELKPMEYKKLKHIEVLASGQFLGYKFAIVSHGSHPCAYVCAHTHYTHYSDAPGCGVHYGFTYGSDEFGNTAYWDPDDLSHDWLGWDYIHFDDYAYYNDEYQYEGKQWTTEEIYEEVLSAIVNLKEAEDAQGRN